MKGMGHRRGYRKAEKGEGSSQVGRVLGPTILAVCFGPWRKDTAPRNCSAHHRARLLRGGGSRKRQEPRGKRRDATTKGFQRAQAGDDAEALPTPSASLPREREANDNAVDGVAVPRLTTGTGWSSCISTSTGSLLLFFRWPWGRRAWKAPAVSKRKTPHQARQSLDSTTNSIPHVLVLAGVAWHVISGSVQAAQQGRPKG